MPATISRWVDGQELSGRADIVEIVLNSISISLPIKAPSVLFNDIYSTFSQPPVNTDVFIGWSVKGLVLLYVVWSKNLDSTAIWKANNKTYRFVIKSYWDLILERENMQAVRPGEYSGCWTKGSMSLTKTAAQTIITEPIMWWARTLYNSVCMCDNSVCVKWLRFSYYSSITITTFLILFDQFSLSLS